jgi:spore cortex biosynthesis protein YabQ
MSLSVQFLSLLAMIGTGIVAAAFIDMIGTGTAHASRKSIVRRRAAWLEVIGWTIAGCWTFYILYLVRDGAWRIYDPVAQMSGMLLYASFFHKPIRFFGRIILLLILKPLWFIVNLFISIIRQIIKIILKVIFFLFTPIVNPIVKLFRKISGKLFKKRGK